MSNELESDRAMVVNLELLEPMLFKLVTTVTVRPTRRPSRQSMLKFDEPAVKITVNVSGNSGHLDCTFPA